MRASDQFHVGIVVDVLDRSLAELTDLFGYDWCDEIDLDQPVALASGESSVHFRFRYSRHAPRLEVIQAQPGTLWTASSTSGIHHLGYWSDDLAADGIALEAVGYELEVASLDTGSGRTWSFHRGPDGPRIELVSRALEPGLTLLWGESD